MLNLKAQSYASLLRPRVLVLGLFLLIAYFPLFLHLDTQPVKNFDESLFALRAYRLAHYGEYLNNFSEFPDGPSATNTKPPFFSLIQAGSYHVLGYHELALRLPVALSVLGLLLAMIFLAQRWWGASGYGYLSALVLLCSWGFVHVHVSRTGDHDAPLAVMGWLALACLYRYLQLDLQNKAWLWGFTACLTAAVLTKSVAGLFFLPAMLAYVLYTGQLTQLLRKKECWYALATFVGIVGAYYLYREWEHPGFLAAMWKGELGGHYFQTRDGHSWPVFWYLRRLYQQHYSSWIWFLPLSAFLLTRPAFKPFRNFGVLMWLALLSWLSIISFSQTKLSWYDASLFPVMASLVGLVLWSLYKVLWNYLSLQPNWKGGLFTLLFLLPFFFYPYQAIIEKVYQPQDNDYPGEYYGYLIKQAARNYPELKDYTLVHAGHSTHSLFYQLVYNQHRSYQIRRKHAYEEMQAGETVMLCQPPGIAYARQHFETEDLSASHGCVLMRLTAEKKNEP